MKRMMFAIFALSLSLVLFNGCFSDTKTSSGSPAVCTDPTVDVTGTWATNSYDFNYTEGTFSTTCYVELYLVQDGSSLSGSSYADCYGTSPNTSTLTGTVCGSSFSGTAVDNSNGNITSVSATVSGTSMNVSFRGSDSTSSWYGSGTLYW